MCTVQCAVHSAISNKHPAMWLISWKHLNCQIMEVVECIFQFFLGLNIRLSQMASYGPVWSLRKCNFLWSFQFMSTKKAWKSKVWFFPSKLPFSPPKISVIPFITKEILFLFVGIIVLKWIGLSSWIQWKKRIWKIFVESWDAVKICLNSSHQTTSIFLDILTDISCLSFWVSWTLQMEEKINTTKVV